MIQYADDEIVIQLIQRALKQIGRPQKYGGDAKERHREAQRQYRISLKRKKALEIWTSKEESDKRQSIRAGKLDRKRKHQRPCFHPKKNKEKKKLWRKVAKLNAEHLPQHPRKSAR